MWLNLICFHINPQNLLIDDYIIPLFLFFSISFCCSRILNSRVISNLILACQLPRVEKKEMAVLTGDDLKLFLQQIKGKPFEYVYFITVFTGLRESDSGTCSQKHCFSCFSLPPKTRFDRWASLCYIIHIH